MGFFIGSIQYGHRDIFHDGSKGMHWGVRRYRNYDGTLTEEGKARYRKNQSADGTLNKRGQKRVRDNIGYGYLNPPSGSRNRNNRDKIREKYAREYWDGVKKGTISTYAATDQGRKLWDKYKSEYAGATLKDLHLRNTDASRKQVQQILKDADPFYDYDYEPQDSD